MRPSPLRHLLLLTVVAALLLGVPTAATAAPTPRRSAASISSLSAQLERAISIVEHAKLTCTTRNTLVRRLRAVDDALLSGRRTGASGLLAAWLAGAEGMQEDGMLRGRTTDRLQASLTRTGKKIGTGWSGKPRTTKKWKALPRCAKKADLGNLGAYEPFQVSDVKFVVQFIVNQIPVAGKFLGPLVMILWPTPDSSANVASMISDAVSSNVRDQLVNKLNGLAAVLNAFLADEETRTSICTADPAGSACASATDLLAHEWIDIRDQFVGDEPTFQWNGESDYRVDLLPMYAQWENLFLTFLREGYMAGPGWGWTPEQVSGYVTTYINTQFTDPAHGVKYVDAMYAKGLPPDATDTIGWAQQNAYIRAMTLQVKVFQDMWPFLDPQTYPNGNPDFVDTRIVYSDPIGEAHSAITPPANVTHAMSQLTWWSLDSECGSNGCGFEQAIKVDNAPEVGTPTGNPDTNGTGHVIDTRASGWGPVVVASGATDKRGIFYPSPVIAGLQFQRASGSYSQSDDGWNPIFGRPRYTFAYDDMVLATAKMISPLKTAQGRPCTDSVIFGFRYSDSLVS